MKQPDPADHFESVEEEMVRLAAEMSLMDDWDMDWNPHQLEEVQDKLQHYEDVVDEHLTTADNICDGYGEPLTDAQIKDIFGIADNSGGNGGGSGGRGRGQRDGASGGATPPLTNLDMRSSSGSPNPLVMRLSDSEANALGLMGLDEAESLRASITSAASGVERGVRSRRSKQARIKDSVATIRGKIRWFQKKIVHEIGNTHEVS